MCSCDRTPLHISIFSPVRTEAVCVKLSQEGLGTVITLLGGETFPGSGQNVTVARCSINNKNITNDSNNKKALWVCTTHRLVWCVCMCVCVLSPPFSFLFILMDLMYASSTPGHVCLAEPTRGGWLVPPSLCLPTCLVQSSLVKCLQTAFRFLFSFFSPLLSFFLSFNLFFFHDQHGWIVALPPWYFTPLPLSVCSLLAPLPLLLLVFNIWSSPSLSLDLSVCINV